MKSLFITLTLLVSGFFSFYSQVALANSAEIVSGSSVSGQLVVPNQRDSYTFSVTDNETIQFRAGANKNVWITVYHANGGIYSYAQNYLWLPNIPNGNYRVDVYRTSNTDPDLVAYELHYVNALSANEHGLLPSGGSLTNDLTLGDLDTYTMSINEGDGFQIRVSSDEEVWITVFDEEGKAVHWAKNYFFVPSATSTGLYRVAVYTVNANSAGGQYVIDYVNGSSANEHGTVYDGDIKYGVILDNELDSYTINVSERSGINITGYTTNDLYFALFHPDGHYIGYGVNGFYNTTLTEGLYTLSVYNKQTSFNTGSSVSYSFDYLNVCYGLTEVQGQAYTGNYSSIDDAAIAALEAAASDDFSHDREIGGRIFSVCSDTTGEHLYYVYEVIYSSAAGSPACIANGGSVIIPSNSAVAIYHTHPYECSFHLSSYFSPADLNWVQTHKLPSYMKVTGYPFGDTIIRKLRANASSVNDFDIIQ